MLRRRYRLACSPADCFGRLISSMLDTRPWTPAPSFALVEDPRNAGYEVNVGVLLACSGLLYRWPTVAIPEPDGGADPLGVEEDAGGAAALSPRR